jgi:hypothetical protein
MHGLRGDHREFIGPVKAKENSFLGVSGQDVGVISAKGYEFIPECRETRTDRESEIVVAKSC